ncbi:hypothetical protein WOLCODRAFT_16575 [Wolfiporia cocos MD-104 SS10]|uniref:Uncharacterized protein n=1 Tax=Wolfiporia cocos (strain MD-104) TaxID=742152 RepID=A0A2H3JE94_WOLCO|nr:hypothetical protein WOLCODRAFT_16575 [Wolfiporia cocos MD-104 SS10]
MDSITYSYLAREELQQLIMEHIEDPDLSQLAVQATANALYITGQVSRAYTDHALLLHCGCIDAHLMFYYWEYNKLRNFTHRMFQQLQDLEQCPTASLPDTTKLQSEIDQLKVELVALKSASPLGNQAPTGTVSLSPHPTPSPVFSGDEKSTNIEEWLFKVKVYHFHMKYTTDRERILDTLTKIMGTAFKYFKDLQDKYN